MGLIRTIVACLVASLLAAPVLAEKAEYLDLAQRGWNYQLRTTMVGRDLSIPVRISGQTLRGAALCIVGDEPHPQSLRVINAFRDLSRQVFGAPITMRYAGESARGCGAGKTVILRLYSGFPPNRALSDDLGWMSDVYQLGLPQGRQYTATSPAIGQTFFGRLGQGTHIMVQQPIGPKVTGTEALYFKSILIEELFQVFTFGMDILQYRPNSEFLSKLQEYPYRAQRLPWNSPDFKRILLHTNPTGLCAFDIFMMHAVALAPVEQTNSDAFIAFIDTEYERLTDLAQATLSDGRFGLILDRECRPWDG